MSRGLDVISGKVPQRLIRELTELPLYIDYTSPEAWDLGAGTKTFIFGTPAGMRGKPLAVNVFNVTETFNSVTTASRVDIGDGSDADEFALTDDFADGTTGQIFTSFDGSLQVGDTEIIQPGDQVTVTGVAPTGGTPTGIATISVTMLYFK